MTMEEPMNYVKRSQHNYRMSLKHQIVGNIERGELSTTGAQRRYEIQSRSIIVGF